MILIGGIRDGFTEKLMFVLVHLTSKIGVGRTHSCSGYYGSKDIGTKVQNKLVRGVLE